MKRPTSTRARTKSTQSERANIESLHLPVDKTLVRADVHIARGPLPTKASALINLQRCARIYSDRQSAETFELLADAVAVARVLRLW